MATKEPSHGDFRWAELEEDIKSLITEAHQARQRAYAPYSQFWVGAALLGRSGKIYQGVNVESCTFTPTTCAERTAILKAVSEGERDFKAIAVVGGPMKEAGSYCPPCGVCRQMMMEFCDPASFEIWLPKDNETFRRFTLEELLPEGFGPERLSATK